MPRESASRIGGARGPASRDRLADWPRPVVDAVVIVGSPAAAADPRLDLTIERFARRVRRLPTFSQVFRAYHRTIDGAGERLQRSARLLNGRFVVANARASVVLPFEVRERLFRWLGRLAQVSPGSTVELRVEEPTDFSIRHSGAGASGGVRPGSRVFEATIDYLVRLVVSPPVGAGRSLLETECEAIADEGDGALPWYRIGLCIPDHDALERMSPEAAHFYRWITGRMGGGSRDEYWHLDAWDQYTEPGRTAGILVPDFLRLPLRSARHVEPQEPNAFDSSGYGVSPWPALTGSVERCALVPPGFCFVEFEATISMCVNVGEPAAPRGGPGF